MTNKTEMTVTGLGDEAMLEAERVKHWPPNLPWEERVDRWMQDPVYRRHLPNRLKVGCVRADFLMTECEHGDHVDYLFPVDVVCSDPPEEIDGVGKMSHDEPGHALIYTDGNVALTLYECVHSLWHVGRDGEWLSGGYLSPSYRLSRESVDKILGWAKEHKPSQYAPGCEWIQPVK